MEKWKHNFTSDVDFIHDSKHIITNLHNHCHTFNSAPIKWKKLLIYGKTYNKTIIFCKNIITWIGKC